MNTLTLAELNCDSRRRAAWGEAVLLSAPLACYTCVQWNGTCRHMHHAYVVRACAFGVLCVLLDSKAAALGICTMWFSHMPAAACAVSFTSCTSCASMKPACGCGSGAYYFATFLPAPDTCRAMGTLHTTIQLCILCTNRLAGHGGCVCRLVFASCVRPCI
jgi:hypothetical protein